MQLDPAGAAEVLTALDALESRDTVPRIEGAERRRLAEHAAGATPTDGGWTPHLVDGWYLGLRRPDPDGRPVAEAGRLGGTPVATVLAAARAAGAGRVWLRGADGTDVASAAAHGWRPARTLHVLARTLDAASAVPAPPGLRLGALAEIGADAVADLLARAYAPARADGRVEVDAATEPWTAARFERLAARTLADPDDLLIAVDADGRAVGVHWLRRRAGAVGEVFNLAVAPEVTGRGVGAWLLTSGLVRLAALGHGTAILWVDAANAPARDLYARTGFAPLGRDVAVEA